MVKPNSKIDPATSPWQIDHRSGLTTCHHCGHPYELTRTILDQHYQYCPWLSASLTDAAESFAGTGSRLLTEHA